MTFGMVYAYTERFMLPLSHDEVVHGKGSLIRKMPGDDWQKFANLRAYFSWMWTFPGKKLLFMGCEIAQWAEWNNDASIDWNLLDYHPHKGMQSLVADLNRLYVGEASLHATDTRPEGFRWLIVDDAVDSVYAFIRQTVDETEHLLVVSNMTPVPRHGYRIGVPKAGSWREMLNSDAGVYGGSNLGNDGGVEAEAIGMHGHDHSVSVMIPPLATIVLKAS